MYVLRCFSERRSGALERLDALARRDGLAAVLTRPFDGDRGRHGGKACVYPIGRGARVPIVR